MSQTEYVDVIYKVVDKIDPNHIALLAMLFIVLVMFIPKIQPLLQIVLEKTMVMLEAWLQHEKEMSDRKFEMSNKTIVSLEQTSDALLKANIALEKSLAMLETQEKKCNEHKKLLIACIDDCESLSDFETDTLKEVVEANQ